MPIQNWGRGVRARGMAIVAITGALGFYGPDLLAATAAGTEIKNLATVTYEDAAGNVYTAQSNEAIVTVAQVYSATLGTDIDTTSAPGQTVYLPHILTNTGNGTDTFNLSVIDGITGGDAIDAESLVIYHDINGNGQADSGEPTISSLTLDAGNSANLVVAALVPPTATSGQTIGITLTAQALEGGAAAVPGSVVDLTTGGGRDSADDTNESLITVTGDAVLVANKSAVHNSLDKQITYTVTIRNTGNAAATDVIIWDALPAGTTYVSGSVSGLLDTNGDTLIQQVTIDEVAMDTDLNGDGDKVDTLESDLGYDINGDGDLADSNVQGIYAIDASISPNATVSLTFTVSYDPLTMPGGAQIDNIAFVSGDTDDDTVREGVVPTNTASIVIGTSYGVTISDSGTGAAAGVNDGGDDDSLANDDQYVDTAATGGTVIFSNIITNTGNGTDVFELSIDYGNFPEGTVFTFWDATNSVQLTDTNSVAGVDSGQVAAGDSVQITVKAILPAGVSGDDAGNEYQATVTATSAGDPSGTPAADSVFESLRTISVAVADLHNSANGTIGTDEDPLGSPEYAAVTTYVAESGTSVNIPLYIDNESESPDAYQLGAGSSWDGSTLGALPAGWSVQFYLGDGSGNPTGPEITATSSLPGLTLNTEIIAVVNVSADQASAIADVSLDNDGDGVVETIDGNGDSDGDYPIFFQIISVNSGAMDVKLDAVDVNAVRAISLTPSGINQVEAGGTVSYPHTLSNTGNSTETVELTATNSQPGWNNTVMIDTDGDGTPDTEIGNLTAGTITVLQPDGTTVDITVTDTDGDGNPELELPQNSDIPLVATILAPTTASAGEVDTLSITATNVDGSGSGPSATAMDQTSVINGQVRLTKTVAVDGDCDGNADSGFSQIQATQVEPGQCAIWEMVAENQGDAPALNVTITDSVTPFSTFAAGSLQYCLSNGCTPAGVSDATGDDAGEISGGNITFYVGGDAVPADGLGGTLVPGELATARFRVIVD